MRGAIPKPSALKVLQGTLRPDRVNRAEPRPPVVDVPACPKWVGRFGREAWRELAPALVAARVMTALDWLQFARACDQHGIYREKRALLDRRGWTFTIDTESGRVIRPRPEVAIMQQAERAAQKLFGEFGLTPASRPRVHAVADDPHASTRKDAVERRFFGARA